MGRTEKREEWLKDVQARQRNIVFPDTAANEARFWRNLYLGTQRLNTLQRVGLLILALIVLVLLITLPMSWGNEIHDSRVGRVLSAAIQFACAFGFLGGFLLLLKWSTGRRQN